MGAWAIALHGGAGMIGKDKMTDDWQKRTEAALNEILDIGIAALENHRSAVEAVELVVSSAFLFRRNYSVSVAIVKYLCSRSVLCSCFWEFLRSNCCEC